MPTVADLRQTIAANIELGRRLDNETSQAELARRTGIDQKEISRYENGRRHPGHERLIKIATALGRSVGWFYDPHDENGEPA